MNSTMKEVNKNWEVSDILCMGMPEYKNRYGALAPGHAKVIRALTDCRTSKLGGHSYACDTCDYEKHVYNSCRDRHCPKCQGLARLQWVENRMEELLPVPYFHVVFTVPSELNPFSLRNKEAFYNLQQQVVAETLAELSQDPKYLGAKIGHISVLHTWGQNLMDHPHIHCIVPGGGLKGEQEWVSCKEEFLFPVKVISRLFKGKFMDKFIEGVKSGDIRFHGQLQAYSDYSIWKHFLNLLYGKEWCVYCKEPFAGPEQVLKYLGGYTHRIAISNNRILDVKDGTVSFTWKDYADNGAIKVLSLGIVEFIRRFLLHVLPKGYQRIRYYGFLSNRLRKKSLPLCFKLLGKIKEYVEKRKKGAIEILKSLMGVDITLCPKCAKGRLVPVSVQSDFEGGFL